MGKFFNIILKYRKTTLILFLVVAFVSAALIPAVTINYDLSKYLPASSQSKVALDKLDREFGYEGASMLMAEHISVAEALALKEKLEGIEGVGSVLWLDDIVDLNQPLSYINPRLFANLLS
jgi:uncharacterized protein